MSSFNSSQVGWQLKYVLMVRGWMTESRCYSMLTRPWGETLMWTRSGSEADSKWVWSRLETDSK